MTSTAIAAMKQALEALELPCDRWNATQYEMAKTAITALRAAIEEAEKQEPYKPPIACACFNPVSMRLCKKKDHCSEVHAQAAPKGAAP